MNIAALVFVTIVCASTALLVSGLSLMTVFKATAEGRAQQEAGRRRLYAAGLLLVLDAGIGALAGSNLAAALALGVASSAWAMTVTTPRWLPLLALLGQVPVLAVSVAFVLAA